MLLYEKLESRKEEQKIELIVTEKKMWCPAHEQKRENNTTKDFYLRSKFEFYRNSKKKQVYNRWYIFQQNRLKMKNIKIMGCATAVEMENT